jgi:hypothetical protein
MARDTGIADRLRRAGLKVVEVAGWKTRGAEVFDPDGSVDHHTAGARSGNTPSMAVCIYGRSDVPGPLCHVLIGRDNTCYVIAAGRANHAGTGGWSGISGNKNVYGIERENVGTTAEPWTNEQTETAARAHAALIGNRSASLVCEHKEWAPNRKIDAHSISGGTMRFLVQRYQNNPSVPQEDDMTLDEFVKALKTPGSPLRTEVAKIFEGQQEVTKKNTQQAVDEVLTYYANSGDSPVHKIVRAELDETRPA